MCFLVCCWFLAVCTIFECDSKVDFTVEVEWRLLVASFLLFVFSCFLGWHRTSGEGRAPRGQCPQSAQYSGHHHCELLFLLHLHIRLALLLSSFALWSVFVSFLCLLSIVPHNPGSYRSIFLLSSICLSINLISLCVKWLLICYFVKWHVLFCLNFLCCHTHTVLFVILFKLNFFTLSCIF